MGNESRYITPNLLKFGAALALSLGGVVYTLIVNKRSKSSQSRHDHHHNKQVNSRSNHIHFDPLSSENHEDFHHSNNTPEGYSRAERDAHEQEIKNLRNTVRILKERESNLEIELLEYYGLKEQETAVMELKNRLKLNNMEAKLFALKIESLQADNRRLEEQMVDYKKVVADLEGARTKIKMLKKKIKSESEQNNKQILEFQQQVQKMEEDERKIVSEVEELRKANNNLQLENTDLAHRLDCVQILATSVLEDGETEKFKEENKNLKKQNEDLSKEVERHQADRCGDVEELVYLRWINACLRHELRNYQPGPGKTTARDLSKNLSPKSEEKAKQLILEYANKEGGIDSEQWSISQSSIITDSGEFDESFIDDQLRQKNSNSFFGKLMRVIRGKESLSSSPSHHYYNRNHSRCSSMRRSESFCDDMMSCTSSENQRFRTPTGGSKRLTHRHSDSSFYSQDDSVAGSSSGRRRSSSSGGQKSELAKYAEALKDSRAKSNLNKSHRSHRSSPSLCFF